MKRRLFIAAFALAYLAGCSDSDNDPCEQEGPKLYDVTVMSEPGETGTATAKSGSVAPDVEIATTAGAEITLSAEPKNGYVFTGWTVVSGGAILSDHTSVTSSFTMPTNNVSIRAGFAVKKYGVTVTGDGHGTAVASIGGESALQAEQGDEITIEATPSPGYAFTRWVIVTGDNLVLTPDVETNPATFTMPGGDVGIRAEFSSTTPHTDYFGTWKYIQSGYWYQVTISDDKIITVNYVNQGYVMEEGSWSLDVINNEYGSHTVNYPTGYEFTGKVVSFINNRPLNTDKNGWAGVGSIGVDGWYISLDGNSLMQWNRGNPSDPNRYAFSGPYYKMTTTTLRVDTQRGTMTEGEAGEVTFPIAISTNILAGTRNVTVSNLPAGITVGNDGDITTDHNGSGTLVLKGDGTQSAGTYPGLTLTMEGVESGEFTLSIIL